MMLAVKFELLIIELCSCDPDDKIYFSVEFCIVELSSIIEFSSVE
jgi:hypothetical protein